jgi:tetratricopeptide (TPR) repeat protein
MTLSRILVAISRRAAAPIVALLMGSSAPGAQLEQLAQAEDSIERRVAAQLRSLASVIERGDATASALEPWVAAEIAFDRLMPESRAAASAPLELRHEAGTKAEAPALRGTDEFAAELARWSDGFERIELELTRATPSGQHLAALVHARASGERGAVRMQQRALWSCVFEDRDAELPPRLVELRVREQEFVRAAPGAPRFVEHGPSAFDADGVYARQLLPGLPHWQERIDAHLGVSFLGHQGLALGDVDGDGLEDVYLCQPGGLPNLLFLKQPDGTTRESGAQAGVDFLDPTASALLLDLDGDGDRDLAALVGEELLFLANDGEGQFSRRGFFSAPMTMSMAAADVDGDGDLDLYLCGYVSPYSNESTPLPYHLAENGAPNRLLLNLGAFRFRNATAELGLDENNRRFSFAAAFEDYDDDGDQDLYVSNDFGRNNLYRNDGGRFRDVAAEAGTLDIAAGMGVSWGDYDRDGRMDLYVSNMHSAAGQRMTFEPLFQADADAVQRGLFQRHARGNSLFRNLGDGRFEDVTIAQGVAEGGWAWGAIFTDFQNDGLLDLFVPNGMATNALEEDLEGPFWSQVIASSPTGAAGSAEQYMDAWRRINSLMRQGWSWHGREPNAGFVQGAGRFFDAAYALGLDHAEDGRAAARVDWDHDGDLDLLITNRSAPRLRLLLNELVPGDDFVAFRLRGKGGNTDAIGARVELVCEGGPPGRHIASVRAGEGFLAQQSSQVHFGLGGARPLHVLVRWPYGGEERFEGIERGAVYVLTQGSARAERWEAPAVASALRPSESMPPADTFARVVSAWPLPTPTLALEDLDGNPRTLLGVTLAGEERREDPLLVIFGDPRELQSMTLLAMLGSRKADFEAAGIQLLALCSEGGEARQAMAAALERAMWNGASACATPEARSVLDVLYGALIDRESPLPLASALLFDERARLIAIYTGTVDPKTILADRGLLDPELDPEARRAAAAPFPGRWSAATQAAPLGYYQSRFEARGLPQAAREYMLGRIEIVRVSPAEAEVQRARIHARAGEFERAEEAFRAAVAADSKSFDAQSGLAVVLHTLRRFDEARVSYARALQLDPDHAETWFNLGLASLALSDRDNAQRAAERLAELSPELLVQLERALATYDAR